MRSGWDSTRRNRNIGTAKQGHGDDNYLTIPSCSADDHVYWERLVKYKTLGKVVGGGITFIVEKTRKDICHACTVDDICHLLYYFPHRADLSCIDLIVLRQPKRKEEILRPVWGRYTKYAEIGPHKGSAIILEAISLDKPLRWPKSLDPDYQDELDRLRADGHNITTTTRNYIITPTLETVRATQLYRTLIHEIGHGVDFKQREKENLPDRISAEKEVFAHNYADVNKAILMEMGIIPFERKFDKQKINEDGLDINDFLID